MDLSAVTSYMGFGVITSSVSVVPLLTVVVPSALSVTVVPLSASVGTAASTYKSSLPGFLDGNIGFGLDGK